MMPSDLFHHLTDTAPGHGRPLRRGVATGALRGPRHYLPAVREAEERTVRAVAPCPEQPQGGPARRRPRHRSALRLGATDRMGWPVQSTTPPVGTTMRRTPSLARWRLSPSRAMGCSSGIGCATRRATAGRPCRRDEAPEALRTLVATRQRRSVGSVQ